MATKAVKIAVFGSTGSIGKSTLDIIRMYPDRFKVEALVANSNFSLLEEQVKEFCPAYAGLAVEESAKKLKSKLSSNSVKVLSDKDIVKFAGSGEYDLMLAAIVGFSGLESVLAAVEAGKIVALANKESLVAGGALVLEKASRSGARIVPVDSEHSAIFQLLEGRKQDDLESITLTASGGPFFSRELKDFDKITPEEALKHPRWKMGPKVSLDSATMFNKALELIEAKWLFSLNPQKIEVLIHPQSIVHSMINFKDGSTLAHLSCTDMKGPIAYAINYPFSRLPRVLPALDLAKTGRLDFFPLDSRKFPAIGLARSTFDMGSAAGAVFNSANEYAGAAFLHGAIPFSGIYFSVNEALSQFGGLNYSSFEDLIEIDYQVKEYMNNALFKKTSMLGV